MTRDEFVEMASDIETEWCNYGYGGEWHTGARDIDDVAGEIYDRLVAEGKTIVSA